MNLQLQQWRKLLPSQHHIPPPLQHRKSLGAVGQLSVLLISFMAVILSLSMFLSCAKKKKKKGADYLQFFIRD
eukprot:1494883-Ditylum_brightwellii.AAC.1